MVNSHKVWKEREDVFNFKQVAAGQTVHCLLHIFLLLHHMASDLQPQLLLKLLVILRQVGARFSQVYINLWTANTSQVSVISQKSLVPGWKNNLMYNSIYIHSALIPI